MKTMKELYYSIKDHSADKMVSVHAISLYSISFIGYLVHLIPISKAAFQCMTHRIHVPFYVSAVLTWFYDLCSCSDSPVLETHLVMVTRTCTSFFYLQIMDNYRC